MLSALLIDDERFAREELAELLAESGQIEVIGQASNAIEGLKKNQSAQARCGVFGYSDAANFGH